ncbi:hypothetical protein Tco_0664588 [Tanacetum coccineum]
MQDKNIAISELKKLIETFKRKGVDTNFEQLSIFGKPPVRSIRNHPVVRQPSAYQSKRYQCPKRQFASQVDVSHSLTKPVTPHSWPQMKESSLAKPNDMIAPAPSRNRPKHVSLKSPREFVDKDVNGKPSMITPARLPNTANGFKPNPRNWQASMSSRVSYKDVHIGEHRKQKPFLKSNDLQCPTCKKCLYSANHDECVLEYLLKLNSRASAQKKDAKSHKTTKRYMPVEKTSESKKPKRQIPTGHSHKVVRLGINPMIQPEPEDLPKDNPKLEIAVLRMKKKCMDKGSKERSPPHNLRQKPGQYICCQNHKLIADIENDIMDPVMQCTTLPSHSGFSQQKLVSFVTEIHTLSIDISFRDR